MCIQKIPLNPYQACVYRKKQQHNGKNLPMKNALTTVLCLLLWVLSIPDPAGATEKALKRVSKAEIARFKREDKVALLVGVATYPQGSGLNSLHYAEQDMQALAQVLEDNGYLVKVLVNTEATTGVVMNTLASLKEIMDRDQGTLVFAFSGHGFAKKGKNYLATYGATASGIERYGLALKDVEQALKATGAVRQVMFIDACRNDPGSGTKGAGLNSFTDYDAEGLRILFSTKAGRVSYENSALGHGVFSHYLIEALQGAAARQGLVTFRQVADYVRKEVRAWGFSQGQVQVPYEAGEASGDFLLLQTSATENARLTIRSNVNEDSVYINGQYKGSTRLELELEPGEYRVRVSKQGYGDWEQMITLEEGAEEVLRAKLMTEDCWSRREPGKVCTESVTGMEFVWVPGGCYWMGQTSAEKRQLIQQRGEDKYKKYYADELPRHEVCVDGFWMGKHELTLGEFRRFVQDTSYRTEAEKEDGCTVWNGSNWAKEQNRHWRNPGFKQGGKEPVVCVSWNDAKAYTRWLSKQTRGHYRLPAEAEWEYAARAGTTTIRYWGDDPDQACRYANVADQTSKDKFGWAPIHECRDGYVYTAPVGSFRANGFGLYDILGNVWEWVGDWYGEDYYQTSPKNNPQGPSSGADRVDRGGGWSNVPAGVRAAYRDGVEPGLRGINLGFRLLRTNP
jgi:formylglycine-generating enzyme required for sulfatase activity